MYLHADVCTYICTIDVKFINHLVLPQTPPRKGLYHDLVAPVTLQFGLLLLTVCGFDSRRLRFGRSCCAQL